MLAQYLDLTQSFNANNGFKIDVSNYDYVVVQFVGPTGTINISATNDSGTPSAPYSYGYDATSTNYQTISATKLADGTLVTAVAAAGLYRTNVVGRYLQYGGTSAAATKVLLQLSKIS